MKYLLIQTKHWTVLEYNKQIAKQGRPSCIDDLKLAGTLAGICNNVYTTVLQEISACKNCNVIFAQICTLTQPLVKILIYLTRLLDVVVVLPRPRNFVPNRRQMRLVTQQAPRSYNYVC